MESDAGTSGGAAVELTFAFGVYRGEVDADGVRHGRGVLTYKNGNVVEGSWVAGALTCADAVKRFRNGDVYSGGFVAGAREGEGRYVFRGGGGQYVGGYKADKQHGHGEWTGKAESYRGGYHAGVRSGYGVEVARGATYEGTWEGGERHGEGTVTFPDGTSAVGRWVNGRRVKEEGEEGGEEGATQPQQQQLRAAPAPAAEPQAAFVDPALVAGLVPALGGGGEDAEADALQQELMQAFQGMSAFGDSMASGIERATAGLSSLEAQLDGLTKALEGIDGFADAGSSPLEEILAEEEAADAASASADAAAAAAAAAAGVEEEVTPEDAGVSADEVVVAAAAAAAAAAPVVTVRAPAEAAAAAARSGRTSQASEADLVGTDLIESMGTLNSTLLEQVRVATTTPTHAHVHRKNIPAPHSGVLRRRRASTAAAGASRRTQAGRWRRRCTVEVTKYL